MAARRSAAGSGPRRRGAPAFVRAVTPPGSFGNVFGFVSTGFNLGGMVAPLLYGSLMDHGEPRAIFMIVTGSIFLALITAITRRKPESIA